MKRTLDLYREAFTRHGRSPASLLIPKGRQAERFASLTGAMRDGGFSVLDYGCGFGDLKTFLESRFKGEPHTEVDIHVKRVISDSIAKMYPIFHRAAVQRLVQEHLDGTRNRGLFIWSPLCFEQWCGTFL